MTKPHAPAADKDPEPRIVKRGRSGSRRGLVENEIYEHAVRLFAERGFAGTSLQDIADAMEITRPALYYYVKSKDELMARLVTELTEGAAARARRISRADMSPAQRLRTLARQLVEERATEPARFRLLDRSEAELPPELADVHQKAKRTVLAEMSRIVDEGILAGQFRPVDARVAALGVFGICNWVAWWFQPAPDRSVRLVADQLAEMAVAGLSKRDEQPTAGDGPATALARLRQDLDYLERILEG